MTELHDLRVALARIEERQVADRERADERAENAQQAADHRHRNTQASIEGLVRKIDTFVPRDEIEEKLESRDDRLSKLESNQNKAAWAIVMAWLGGLSVVGNIFLRTKGG